ncbi:MAG: hypothetical protein R6X02_17540 [Enhygromyxa sp.]
MFEALVAILIVACLVLAAVIPAMTLLWLGAAIGTIGALLGVPAGIVYHARLWRALRARGLGTEGFWLRPHTLHDKLSDAELRPVQLWFAIGVAGFVLTLAGGAGVGTAMIRLLAP